MGNAAAKQLDETVLGVGSFDDEKAIAKSLMTADEGTTNIKSKGKKWVKISDKEETLLWKYKHVGMIKSHTVVFDSTEKPIAIIVTAKKGMGGCTNFICRPVPSYDGQEPLTAEELAGAGIKDTGGESLYKFAKIECSKKSMSTATCTYGLITEGGAITTIYEGEKLASMGFRAIFKETDGTVIGKAYMPGMSFSPHMDFAPKADMLAVVSMGYALAGDESSAGALAGAGVV